MLLGGNMDFEKLSQSIKKHRRYLHTIPELGFEEFKTSTYIKETLKELGYNPISILNTGVLVYIEGKEKECYGFRADIDALPIQEETGVSFASTHEGKMHACGHDGHTSILLGFAEGLKDIKPKKSILLIFQPAEESPGGAKFIVDEGILSKYKVQAVFGLHLFPSLAEGIIGTKPGPFMAQTGEIDITIKGKSGHGAMPHTTIDTVLITAKLLEAYQSIISRNISPIDSAVLTFGKIEGGTARNIIAETVRIEGTCRTFSKELFNNIVGRMQSIHRGFEEAFGVEITEDIRPMYPPVINTPSLYEKFRNATADFPYEELEPVMLAEDFSYYQEAVSGLFFFLGVRNESLGYTNPLHNCGFNFVEEVLVQGVKVYEKLLKEFDII